jgi:predicted TIM-barrel fold metal-dependent hydrolase
MRFLFVSCFTAGLALGQTTMSIEEYAPKSTLVVPQNPVTRAKYPFIDVHSHPRGAAANVEQLLRDMDSLNLRTMVVLDGGSGERLQKTIKNLRARYPERFAVFCNLDFSGVDDPDWSKRTVKQLEDDVANGAQGLKTYKNLGMTVRDAKGQRIRTDDPRFNPVWSACGRLKIPVLIHTGEPKSFYDPMDKYNERWLHLKEIPSAARPPDKYPSFEQMMAEQHRVFEKHPKTIFINAHLGWYGNDLGELGRLMDRLPNMYTEIGAVVAELGRQPRFARQWFIRYQDRVLFGKDMWAPSEYPTIFRVLESADEYFDYYRRRHAFWQMYGLDLPDEVLKKLYYKNALRLIPGLKSEGFPK